MIPRTIRPILLVSLSVALVACGEAGAQEEAEVPHPIVVTTPAIMDVPTTQGFVCQIHSRRHIEVRALDEGYLEEIPVREGQRVQQGQLMFRIVPILYRARLDAHRAELNHAEIQLRNTRQLSDQGVVSPQELALATAERDRVRAEMDLAAAELRFTNVVAPFDGIIDRQHIQQGSLVEEGDMLTEMSDNDVMWVYFNVPEADYLRFKSLPGANDPANPQELRFPGATIQLRLANGTVFDQVAGDTVTVESTFDSETGNVQFRADFPNPVGLLRHGQTGTLLINEALHDVPVIPQRAVFDILDRQYVFVVGDDGVVHQREITVAHESDDIFVIGSGLEANERYILDGVRQVHDGEHVNTEVIPPEQSLSNLQHHAE
ncbi:MAG: efflux RND transporter periplasmic adaptor subunit [Sandaracinaceae bacterium]|nr:efflux RND transporter periplasmic adaptor subunit [Sandaracinaceae bacterium]